MIAFGLLLSLPIARPCAAQDALADPTVEPEVQPEISRQEWLVRVQEAKRKAREVAAERRSHPDLYAPSPEDQAHVASERALNDGSLQPGDIVSTDKGLFVFRGRLDQHPTSEDFVQIPRR
ncbi:hypothetical protein [Bradyrhizobium canariense]|nr:hypothetical protein [Bradyrhizobium canariense]